MKILDMLTAKLLRLYRPGYLPEPIFFEMCRLNTLSSVEIIIRKSGSDRVFLEERNDKYFGNVWHIPGTMVRGNESPDDAFYRLAETLIGKISKSKEPIAHNFSYYHKTKRGSIMHHVVFADGGDTNCGVNGLKDFSLKRLPKNTLNYHRNILKRIDFEH